LFRTILCALALSASVATPALATSPDTTVPIKHVHVIGDSLSDQGNLLFATADLGPALGLPPIPDPLRYANGRFTNGPNYVDLLAARLRVSVSASELGGSNFAFGGSRTDYNRVEALGIPYLPDGFYPPGAYPWSLDEQVAEFLAAAKHRRTDPTGLYIVFHGSNDLADALAGLAFGEPPAPKIAKAVRGVVHAVLAYKSAGARTILVMLSPNLGQVPSVMAKGPQAVFFGTLFSKLFNTAVRVALANIDEPNIIVFDTFAFMGNVFENAASYGLTNVTTACYAGFVYPSNAVPCADPEHYAFWDFEHPTNHLFENVQRCRTHGKGNGPAHCAVNRH
jgi:phospholipase/lecithinase/hemolysin